VTWSGAFSERVDSAIQSHSGFICVDVDNCQDPAEIRAKLANDPYIQAAFISPTGTGCKALVRIPPQADAHAQSFAAARKHFREAHGVTIDEACKNLSRLCYIAHDADAFIRNKEAELLEPIPEEKPEAPRKPEAPPLARDVNADLTAKCGLAFYLNDKGGLVINQNYFVQRICRENLVFFEYDENRFYRYNAKNGAWEAVAPGVVKELVRSEWGRSRDPCLDGYTTFTKC
jgi:hypothetical protein